MAITFLNGSCNHDLESRINSLENNGGGNGNGLASRVNGLESRMDDMESSVDSQTSALSTTYDTATTILSALVGALNTTNAKVNQHDTVLAAKGWLS